MAPRLKCAIIGDGPDWGKVVHDCLAGTRLRIEAVRYLETLTALEFLPRNPADLVIVDFGTWDSDGLLFIEEFRRCGCETPVIVVSARDYISSEALARGATACLRRATLAAELPRTIEALCAGSDLPATV